MNKKDARPIVAELGRPETDEEIRTRKKENSRLHRQRQTVNNLVLSLLASLGLVLIIVLIVPRGVGDFEKRSVDVVTLAEEASNSAGITLAAPDMADDWLAKQALLRSSRTDNVTHWFIAYTTPDNNFASVMQAFTSELEPANETWVAEHLERKLATGMESLAGHEWTQYDHGSDNKDETNVTFAISTELDQSMLIISGTASPEEIRLLAEKTIASLIN